jgi:tRNA1(Val) A37 N6-methylase TrmN6
VLLAAALPAIAGDELLELGSGAGVASLCVATRVPGAKVSGIEIEPELVAISNANAVHNGMADRVRFLRGDASLNPVLDATYAHVFFNPPFHPPEGTRSRIAARDVAKRDSGSMIRVWTGTAMGLWRPGSTITAILRSDRVGEMLAPAAGISAIVLPLHAAEGQEPKRSIVQLIFERGRVHHRPGLVLHREGGGNTDKAESILRHGKPLLLSA